MCCSPHVARSAMPMRLFNDAVHAAIVVCFMVMLCLSGNFFARCFYARAASIAALRPSLVRIVYSMALKRPAASMEQTTAERYAHLMTLGRAAYVSQSGMAKLLETVKEGGLPQSFSRSSQYRARKHLSSSQTPYGPLVSAVPLQVVKKGKTKPIDVGFQNPLAFFHYHSQNSPHYAAIVKRTLALHPPSAASPWKIIFYQDGVDPSDGLSKSHTRKSVVFYWSVLEFGMDSLAHEEVWGTVVVVRASLANKVKGRVMTIFDHVLRQFFGDTHDISRAGICVEFDDVVHRIIAGAKVLLADLPALKECIDCKGHAGTKPCHLCKNCVQHNAPSGSVPLHLFSDYAVSIAEADINKFEKHTDASIIETLQKLRGYKGVLTNDEFELREQLLGFNYNPEHVALNPRFQLKIASMTMYDWAHIYVSDGIGDSEFGVFMKNMSKHSRLTSYTEFGEYAQSYSVPKYRGTLKHLFDPDRYRNYLKTESFPAIASDFLTLTPILRRYLSHVVAQRGEGMQYVRSIQAVLDVIDILQAVKAGAVRPEVLGAAIRKHLELYKAAYGDSSVRPKHHYALHLPDMLARFGTLLATFTHERKHRLVVRYTRRRMNLTSWETGTIEDITCHGIWELSKPFFQTCTTSIPRSRVLQTLLELFPNAAGSDVTIHTDITLNGGVAKNGDVISYEFDGSVHIGELIQTVGIDDGGNRVLLSFVTMWQLAADTGERDYRKYTVTSNNVRVPTAKLGTCFTYRMSNDLLSAMVCVPFECR